MNDTSPLSHLHRRRLLQLAGGAALSVPVFGTFTGPSAGQTSDEIVIANEAEPADLSPWFKGFGHVLVTRQLYETLVEPRMTQLEDGTVDIEWVPVLAESWEQIEPTR